MIKRIFLLFTTLIIVGGSLYIIGNIDNEFIISEKVNKTINSKLEDAKKVGNDVALKTKEKVVNYIHEQAYKLVDDAFKRIETKISSN
jgi:hypothetical protein